MTRKNTTGIRTKKINFKFTDFSDCSSKKYSSCLLQMQNHTHQSRKNYPAARLFCCHSPFSSDKIIQCTLHIPVHTAVLCQDFLQCTQDIFAYSDIGMVYSGICMYLENRYRHENVLHIDKCTLQYFIRLIIGYI